MFKPPRDAAYENLLDKEEQKDQGIKNNAVLEDTLRQVSVPYVSIADAPPPFAPQDRVEDHILAPNASNLQEIVEIINRDSSSSIALDALCCTTGLFGCVQLASGRVFTTEIGKISIWLDANKRPHAYTPNEWHTVANFMYHHLGTYDMASPHSFENKGVCIIKIEAGKVVFANKGGKPVMIVAKDNQTGWYVSTEAGFSFADKIHIDNVQANTTMASISADYIRFESLHLFNVQPNTLCIVSKPAQDGLKSEFSILTPGPHSYNSPYMRFLATIPTSVQDVIITEKRISTQDGVVLSQCNAVLSYRIKIAEAQNLLLLDVRNYSEVIRDWAKRTMLHEIGNTNYQSYRDMDFSDASASDSSTSSSCTSHHAAVLGHSEPTSQEEGAPFRPTLEHKMQQALREKLKDYGVEIVTFALQSFEPPQAIAEQVTAAIAKRTQAHYGLQAQRIDNQTVIAKAEAAAVAINIEAKAIVAAAKQMEGSSYAQRLKLADKQASIASAWTNGNARTLVLGAPTVHSLTALNLTEDAEQRNRDNVSSPVMQR